MTDLVLRASAAFTSGDFSSGALLSGDALARARTVGSRRDIQAALSICILTATALEWTAAADDAVAELFTGEPEAVDRLDRFLYAEAALAVGALDVAVTTLARDGRLPDARPEAHDFPVLVLQFGRVLLFQGRPAEALPHLEAARRLAIETGDELWTELVESVLEFTSVRLGRPARVDRDVRDSAIEPSYLADIRLAYLAYAADAGGDLVGAAETLGVLDAPAFSRLQIADRALAIDILVRHALSGGDVDEAERLAAGLLPVAGHPVAAAFVEQVFSRVDLARGNTGTSIQRTEIAAARADLAGRYRDAASARLIRARALADGGRRAEARDEFSSLLIALEDSGDFSLATELRRAMRARGIRPRPALGAGWDALTDREREVAVLVAGGLANRTIAASLFLSERTVEGHVSRILHALGSSNRAGLPALVPVDGGPRPRDPLTPRQSETADLVAHGLTNAQIAEELGITVRTVEKHVSDILDRWGLESRTQIARALR
ncbi:LuxR C-terminal-related transcriptional regulator [Schumannella luteola]